MFSGIGWGWFVNSSPGSLRRVAGFGDEEARVTECIVGDGEARHIREVVHMSVGRSE